MTARAFSEVELDAIAQAATGRRRRRVLWAPYPGMQTRAVNAAEDEVFFGGAKGPGKTDVGVALLARQTNKERYRGYALRETGPQLSEVKERMHRLYPKLASKPAWNGDGHGRWRFPSGAQIILEAIGTVDEIDRIQGKEPSVVYHDEVANVQDERVVDLTIAELRSPDPTIRCFWRGSGNPGKAGHPWVKRRYIDPCGADGRRILVRRVHTLTGVATITRRFIPGTVLDNPIYANDPRYMAQLALLPEVLRKQLLYGDWNAGMGTALDELDERVHFVKPFVVPDYWVRFSGFDYGYTHPWVWVYCVVTEDGDVFAVDTVRGRKQQVHHIAERVRSRVPLDHPSYIGTQTDSYVFQKNKSRDENTPTIADQMLADHAIVLTRGNTDRKAGLTNLRYYLAWKGLGRDGADGLPALRFFDTPGNRWLFEQLQAMVVDPGDMEDVLKVDANPETGFGGDDGYDALRVAMASRPPRAIGAYYRGPVRAFSHQTLAYMVEQLYRDVPDIAERQRGAQQDDLSTYLTGVA